MDKPMSVVVKPIVYGNVSRYLGKKREGDGRTHEWTVFFRPCSQTEDLSKYIKKVQFKLHESYQDPLRTINEPPFEITETGWGEFDITMKIIFTDSNEKPLTITHLIKLFHCDHDIMMGNKSLVREIYDELVFVEPSAAFYRCLMNSTMYARNLPFIPHETDFNEAKKQSNTSINHLNSKITQAISIYRDHLKQKKEQVEQMRCLVEQTDFNP